MAEQEGRWVTVNGAHVFIKDGESENPFASMKKTVDKKRRKQLIKEHWSNQKPLQKYNAHPYKNKQERIEAIKKALKSDYTLQNGKLVDKLRKELKELEE